MAEHKSPGQKRKRIVQILMLIVFVAATYGGSILMEAINTSSQKWMKTHKEVTGSVTALTQETEEYRNLKGRKRTRSVYTLSYDFTVDGEDFENTVKVSSGIHASYQQGDSIQIWYAPSDPSLNDAEKNAQAALAGNNPIENMIDVVPYSLPICLFLYWLLSIVFVKESKKSLPEGFYTDSSWLDIDDNYVVAIDGEDLVFFDVHDKQASKVQKAYQNDAPLEELIAISKSSKFKRVPLAEITALGSDHNSDVFRIKHGDDDHSVEFLNQTVKAHALKAVQKLLPESLEYSKIEKTRVQAMMPSLIFLALLVVVGFFADIFWLNVGFGFIAIVWTLPTLFSRAIDPTVTEKWDTVTESAS